MASESRLASWHNIQTGVPITFCVWTIDDSAGPQNSIAWFAVGIQGIYIAPTRYLASKHGHPRRVQIHLWNPFALHIKTGVPHAFDLTEVRRWFDSIVIVEGETPRQGIRPSQDLRQGIMFRPDQIQPVTHVARILELTE